MCVGTSSVPVGSTIGELLGKNRESLLRAPCNVEVKFVKKNLPLNKHSDAVLRYIRRRITTSDDISPHSSAHKFVRVSTSTCHPPRPFLLLRPPCCAQLRINFNITMLALPCDYASVDVLDLLGTNKVNMTQNIVKVCIHCCSISWKCCVSCCRKSIRRREWVCLLSG